MNSSVESVQRVTAPPPPRATSSAASDVEQARTAASATAGMRHAVRQGRFSISAPPQGTTRRAVLPRRAPSHSIPPTRRRSPSLRLRGQSGTRRPRQTIPRESFPLHRTRRARCAGGRPCPPQDRPAREQHARGRRGTCRAPSERRCRSAERSGPAGPRRHEPQLPEQQPHPRCDRKAEDSSRTPERHR